MHFFKKTKKQEGVAILVSVLFIGILLSIVFALSAIFIPKLKSAAEIKNSVTAAYAAESELEWCLYELRVGDVSPPAMANGSTYVPLAPADCSVSPVRAVGSYRGVTRAFELSF